jgi:hypothetical protein
MSTLHTLFLSSLAVLALGVGGCAGDAESAPDGADSDADGSEQDLTAVRECGAIQDLPSLEINLHNITTRGVKCSKAKAMATHYNNGDWKDANVPVEGRPYAEDGFLCTTVSNASREYDTRCTAADASGNPVGRVVRWQSKFWLDTFSTVPANR